MGQAKWGGGGHDVALAWDDPQDHVGSRKFGVAFVQAQDWHLPPQYHSFGSKLSSKGKPETSKLLETFQYPVVFFRRAELFRTAAGVSFSEEYFCN